ncbi:peptidoglycan-binding protein [Levilactobacillus brevis]|nr:peptidoglycan-binding protein [Levilactobacillus brevis]
MSQKQDDPTSKEQESHPWDSSFADDRDDQGNLSRTKMRRQNHSNTMVTVILIAIIVVIAAASLVYGLARQSAVNRPQNTEKVAASSSSSSSHSAKASSIHKRRQLRRRLRLRLAAINQQRPQQLLVRQLRLAVLRLRPARRVLVMSPAALARQQRQGLNTQR